MINIQNKKDCCGCQACVQKCPKHCINLYTDNEGFLYPKVDLNLCIDCNLCERVCPIIDQDIPKEPLGVYAAKNTNEQIRKESSSGGIFTMLAEKIINDGGIVFGAKWNNEWHLIHDFTDTIDGLKHFRGSKYLQSDLSGSFIKVERFLKDGRKVLFSGTPCQIAGLKRYLRLEYDNLLLVDFICHGVPSPGIFHQYMKEMKQLVAISDKKKCFVSSPINLNVSEVNSFPIKGIYFRDKSFGWKNFCFAFHTKAAESCPNTVLPSYTDVLTNKCCCATLNDIRNNLLGGKFFTKWSKLPPISVWNEGEEIVFSTSLIDNVFMRGFLKDIYLRPSCYACPTRKLKSGADITLGDYWGINTLIPDIDDDKGISALVIGSKKGEIALQGITPRLWPTSYVNLTRRNPALINVPKPHYKREAFFLHNDWSVHQRIILYAHDPFFKILREILMKIAFSVIPRRVIFLIKYANRP